MLTMLSRPRTWVGIVALGATLVSACSHTASQRQTTKTRTTVGELVPPVHGAGQVIHISKPFDQDQIVLPCSQVVSLLGGAHVFSLAHPPAGAGHPVCYVEPVNGNVTKPDGSPDLPNLTRQFSVGVLYMPDDLSPTKDSGDTALHRAQGGLLIEGRFGPGAGPDSDMVAEMTSDPAPPGPPEARLVYVNGHQVLVSRPDATAVSVQLILHEPNGHRVKLGLIGNYTPDEMAAFAGDLLAAEPGNERPLETSPTPTPPGPGFTTTTRTP
jgi:hypothetical protein